MNSSQTISLLKRIEADTSTTNTSLGDIDTSLNNIETNSNTLASAVSSSEMACNITNLTAFSKGIGNAGAGSLNVVIASDDPSLTNIHTRLSAIETNTNNQDTNLSSIDTS